MNALSRKPSSVNSTTTADTPDIIEVRNIHLDNIIVVAKL